MKILHVATRHRRGGAERNLLHTALWEAEQGHEVHLALGRDSMPGEIPDVLTTHLVRSLVRDVSPIDDLRAYRDLRRLIGKLRPDVVHTHQSKAGVLGRSAARGITPVVVHTIHMASFGDAYSRASSAAFVRLERVCARWSDVIVSVGEELRRAYLDAGVGRADQYIIIRSPIEIERFLAVRKVPIEVRARAAAQLGLDSTTPVAAVVSSLERRKRVALILRALAPLVRAGNLVLVVAGDGTERAPLGDLAEELGISAAVHFLGHVEDVPQLLSTSSLLVHAATVEGVPQVTIQALAAGIPVVATDMMGLREVPGSVMAIVRPTGDGLATAVETALRRPPQPPAPEAFHDWTGAGVDGALATLHVRIMEIHRRRTGHAA